MARLTYADPNQPETNVLAQRIVAERGSLLHLYAMLLHSVPVAGGWLNYLTAIRHDCTLPGSIRELVIMQIAHLNGAPYEAQQHAPIALTEGLSRRQIEVLPDWRETALFTSSQRAALAYCDAMTRDVHVPSEVFAEVRTHFDDRHLVELTATIAAYNMVSRFLEALGITATDDLISMS